MAGGGGGGFPRPAVTPHCVWRRPRINGSACCWWSCCETGIPMGGAGAARRPSNFGVKSGCSYQRLKRALPGESSSSLSSALVGLFPNVEDISAYLCVSISVSLYPWMWR